MDKTKLGSWVVEKLVAGSLSSRLKFPKIKQTATSGPAADKRAKPGGSRRAEFIIGRAWCEVKASTLKDRL